MYRAVIGALLLFAPVIAQQPARVQGRAVDSTTGQPLARVHIRLFQLNDTSSAYGAISRDDGNFSMSSVNPGRYIVMAELAGYGHLPEPSDTDLPMIAIKAGEQIDSLAIRMARLATISGRVVDQDGQPLATGTVVCEPVDDRGLDAGMLLYGRPAGPVRNGTYRYSVIPGKYYVQLFRGSTDEILPDGTFGKRYYPFTYFPDAPSRASATVVEIKPGADITGMDMRVTTSRALSISGTVAGAPPQSKLVVEMLSPDQINPKPVALGPDGGFEVKDLRAGKYSVFASTSGGSPQWSSRVQEITLQNSSVSDIVLALQPATSVRGTLRSDVPLPAGTSRQVFLESSFNRRYLAAVNSDGQFAFQSLPPAIYTVHVEGLPEDAFIQTIDSALGRVGYPSSSPLQTVPRIDLSQPGATGLELMVRNGARISGKVTDRGEPTVSLSIALIPEGKTAVADKLRARIETTGIYSFPALLPGRYRLVVTDPLKPGTQPFAKDIEIKQGDRIVEDIERAKL